MMKKNVDGSTEKSEQQMMVPVVENESDYLSLQCYRSFSAEVKESIFAGFCALEDRVRMDLSSHFEPSFTQMTGKNNSPLDGIKQLYYKVCKFYICDCFVLVVYNNYT